MAGSFATNVIDRTHDRIRVPASHGTKDDQCHGGKTGLNDDRVLQSRYVPLAVSNSCCYLSTEYLRADCHLNLS
jgi:hypothetical protein